MGAEMSLTILPERGVQLRADGGPGGPPSSPPKCHSGLQSSSEREDRESCLHGIDHGVIASLCLPLASASEAETIQQERTRKRTPVDPLFLPVPHPIEKD